MPQYLDRPCRCPAAPYMTFDNLLGKEMGSTLTAHHMVNKTPFCTMIQPNMVSALDRLTLRDLLHGLNDRVGVYHLWRNEDSCDIHQLHHLECVYVGKGDAQGRVRDHLKKAEATPDKLLDPDELRTFEQRRV